ncbi:carbon-nitrogen hydrolase [Tirmania nivea]|nr:carbon-nitrogen hydrolase [Tirmania nivea]
MPLLACGQFRATPFPLRNLASCTTLFHLARRARAQLLFLPEASDYIAPTPAETISLAKPIEESVFVNGLRKLAGEFGVGVVVGVHEPAEEGRGVECGGKEGKRRVRNVCLYIDEGGAVSRRYQKVHVFDVDIEGGPRIKESNTTEPGNTLTPPFPTPLNGLNLGLQICFDLRFPEPSLSLVRRGAHILSYPSAFTLATGRAGHWATLLRARAIETQSYVVGAALIGEHCLGRASWGEAMIVGPWGEVLGRCESWDEVVERGSVSEGRESGEGSGVGAGMERICIAEVERGVVERVRREVPLRRRL